MNRLDLMIENLATELMVSGPWGFCLYSGWKRRGFYHFRHPTYVCKVTLGVSSECKSEERIKRLLKCELRRRWTRTGYRPGYDHYGPVAIMYHDPCSFHSVVRNYLRTNNSKQLRLA